MSKKKKTLDDVENRIMKFPPLPTDNFVRVYKSLGRLFGDRSAIVLQVIQDELEWVEYSHKIKGQYEGNYIEGTYWVYKKHEEFIEDKLPYWNVNKLRRALKVLVDLKVVIKGNFHENKSNQTVWYTIDYDLLKAMLDCNSTVVIYDTPVVKPEQGVISDNSTDVISDNWLIRDTNKIPSPATAPEEKRSEGSEIKPSASPADISEAFSYRKISSCGIDVDTFLKNFRDNFSEKGLKRLMESINSVPTPKMLAKLNAQYRFIRSECGYDIDNKDWRYRNPTEKDEGEKSTDRLDEIVINNMVTGRSKKSGSVDPDMLQQVIIRLINQAVNPDKNTMEEAFVCTIMSANTYEQSWKTIKKQFFLENTLTA